MPLLIRKPSSTLFPPDNEFPFVLRLCALLTLCGPLLTGCQKAGSTERRPESKTADTTAAADRKVSHAQVDQDIWDAYYLQGTKIGYAHTTIRKVQREGQSLVETDSRNHLVVARFGQQAVQDVRLTTLETPLGQLLTFSTEVSSGGSLISVNGRVEGDQLLIDSASKGRSESAKLPWASDIGGFRAVEDSLEREPLQPGQQRRLKMLMPLVNQVASVELAAREVETTSVLGIETQLLRVDSTARLPSGQAMTSTLWVDHSGRAIKTHIKAFDQESFRTTRELAMAPPSGASSFDLGSDLIIRPNRPLLDAHQTKQVRYRVELADGNPAESFASDGAQTLRSIDDRSAEITVRSIRPGATKLSENAAPPPDARYTAANSVLQSDDPRLQAMAREARAGATAQAEIARKLEKYVHELVSKKGFSQAFATAAEVAESREGDCTEHAVLLAALLRASGIPSRVAIGLVYVVGAGGFGYHMWTEAYLDGQWIGLDGIMGAGGTSAAYLKLTDSSLDGASAYSSFLPVAQVAGQLKISVLDSQP